MPSTQRSDKDWVSLDGVPPDARELGLWGWPAWVQISAPPLLAMSPPARHFLSLLRFPTHKNGDPGAAVEMKGTSRIT